MDYVDPLECLRGQATEPVLAGAVVAGAGEQTALTALSAATAIDLGPRILRAETAALAALAPWQAATGDQRHANVG